LICHRERDKLPFARADGRGNVRSFAERILRKSFPLYRSFLLRIALPLCLVVALPTVALADQWGFSNAPRRSAQRPPVQTISPASAPTVVVDKTSGRYLQSVGKRVADRPLACPPKRVSTSAKRAQH
jgi:hypothetical protein